MSTDDGQRPSRITRVPGPADDAGPEPLHVTLDDGRVVPVRPIRPTDAPALQRFHRGLSDRSVLQRFFRPLPELPDEQARYFTEVDGERRFALVALDPARPEEIIGVVRFDRDQRGTAAEYAAIVTDRWQGRGLGSGMTWLLIEAARRRGVGCLYALVRPDNQPMLTLLRHLGLPNQERFVEGVERIEVYLGE